VVGGSGVLRLELSGQDLADDWEETVEPLLRGEGLLLRYEVEVAPEGLLAEAQLFFGYHAGKAASLMAVAMDQLGSRAAASRTAEPVAPAPADGLADVDCDGLADAIDPQPVADAPRVSADADGLLGAVLGTPLHLACFVDGGDAGDLVWSVEPASATVEPNPESLGWATLSAADVGLHIVHCGVMHQGELVEDVISVQVSEPEPADECAGGRCNLTGEWTEVYEVSGQGYTHRGNYVTVFTDQGDSSYALETPDYRDEDATRTGSGTYDGDASFTGSITATSDLADEEWSLGCTVSPDCALIDCQSTQSMSFDGSPPQKKTGRTYFVPGTDPECTGAGHCGFGKKCKHAQCGDNGLGGCDLSGAWAETFGEGPILEYVSAKINYLRWDRDLTFSGYSPSLGHPTGTRSGEGNLHDGVFPPRFWVHDEGDELDLRAWTYACEPDEACRTLDCTFTLTGTPFPRGLDGTSTWTWTGERPASCHGNSPCAEGLECMEDVCLPPERREVCDGVDNDGDAEVDEGVLCEEGMVCEEGTCVLTPP